ncbi:hypothetical protein GCM10022223_46200 [Kineosporia mesophila]|uniref:Uncharacterized protein n=1 Tax=Kineosporia mesophila TaxID=566012 RepID=A0ABP7A319_9ACTN
MPHLHIPELHAVRAVLHSDERGFTQFYPFRSLVLCEAGLYAESFELAADMAAEQGDSDGPGRFRHGARPFHLIHLVRQLNTIYW